MRKRTRSLRGKDEDKSAATALGCDGDGDGEWWWSSWRLGASEKKMGVGFYGKMKKEE